SIQRSGACPTESLANPQHTPDTAASREPKDLRLLLKEGLQRIGARRPRPLSSSRRSASPTPRQTVLVLLTAQHSPPQTRTPDGSSHREKPSSFLLQAHSASRVNAENRHTQMPQRKTSLRYIQQSKPDSEETAFAP